MRATLLAFLALFLPSNLLLAQSPSSNAPVTPVSAQPSGDPYANEAYVFDLIEKKIQFEPDGKGMRDVNFRVRIQSEAAVHEFGLLAYAFASSFESLDVISARVRKPDGTIVDTPASGVQELDSAVSREAPMYTDQREKHIAIKALSVGDILEVHLRWTTHDPIVPGYFWFDDSYFRLGICLKQVFEFRLPKGVPVVFHYSDPQPSMREEGNYRVYTFESSHLKKEPESKIPAWEKDFHGADPPDLRLTSFSSWENVGKWFGGLVQSRLAMTPEIRAKAEELTRDKASEDDKIHAIYDFVSTRFRYIAVDLGQGRYAPHAAPDVLANRYGDCKDKHVLFASLLQAAGIEAFPVLIGTTYRLDPSLPSPSPFNHVITAIPHGQSSLFLDTSPEVAPFGLLVGTLRDRQALLIPQSAPAHLVTTPADPALPNRLSFHLEATIDPHGTLNAKVRREDRGDTELLLRVAYRTTPQSQWQELTQNLMGAMGFGGQVSNVVVTPPEDLSKPFSLSFDYHRADLPEWKNHRITLPVPIFALPSLTDEQKLSKDPLPLGSSQEIVYEATVKVPEDFSVLPPDNIGRISDFADFSAKYSLKRLDTIQGTLDLKLFRREIPGEERSAYTDLVKTIDEASRRYIFIKGNFPRELSAGSSETQTGAPLGRDIPTLEESLHSNPGDRRTIYFLGQAYLSAGRPKNAVSLFEKSLSQVSDSDGQLAFSLAQAYLAVPDPEKAFAQYQKALGDSPTPFQLNNAAWYLADAGVHLKDALEYSRRAVVALSSETVDASADDAEPARFVQMLQLAAYWDTLGWVHFRLDDNPAAQKYLEAAWQLSQSATIGEHLVEVYEKLGKSQNAANICLMALAAWPDPLTKKKLSDEWDHLRPLMKGSYHRNERPESAGAMALSDLRTVQVPFHTKLQQNSRSAHFVLSITNGSKADNVTFSSGAEELRDAIADLSAIRYPQSFPDETPVRIFRKAILSCSVYVKNCTLVFIPVIDAAIPGS